MPVEDNIPEEDKLLRKEQQLGRCQHEWCDMYAGNGYKRGEPTVALQAFYCKKCLVIRVKSFDQSMYNLQLPDDSIDFRDV